MIGSRIKSGMTPGKGFIYELIYRGEEQRQGGLHDKTLRVYLVKKCSLLFKPNSSILRT